MGSEFGGGSEVSDTSEGTSDAVPSPIEEVKPVRRLSREGMRRMQGLPEELVSSQGKEDEKTEKPASFPNQQNKP